MKKTVALLALIALPAIAHAQFFVEGAFGGAKADLRDFEDLGFSTDEASGTWALGGGFMFNRFFGVEAGYRSIGDSEITSFGAVSGSFSGQPFSSAGPLSIKADAKGVYVGPLFETFVDHFRLNARVGMFAWKSDITTTSGGAAVKDKDDGLDAYAGVGFAYEVTGNAFFGMSWTRFRVLDEIDVDAFDIRLKYSF
jgi:OOP family OmpA-OmpF porin